MAEEIEVVVSSVTPQAEGISAWELRRRHGGELPRFAAGAHIDLHLANGMVRSYSLCNSQDERERYVVAINKDPASRGGSKFIHDTLRSGDRLRISPPRNNFPLVEDASHVVFIAGGIGITPLWGMIQRLEKLGRSWQIHYSTRLRQACAFGEQLAALEQRRPGRVHFNFDQEPGGKMINLHTLVASLPAEAQLYCCGPDPMIRAFESAAKAAGRPPTQVHVEYFTGKHQAAVGGGFTVMLARSGKSFQIPPGQTILGTLLDHQINVRFSCMQGVCGTCEVKVLDGLPDHRDSILSPDEQAANQTMMICCSGSKSPKLVLDI